jgi:hypothetical protein
MLTKAWSIVGEIPDVTCPLCDEVLPFSLVEVDVHLAIMGLFPLPGTSSITWELRCAACKFKHFLSDDDVVQAEKAAEIFRQAEARKLPQRQAEEAIRAIHFAAIQDRKTDTPAHICPNCGEESPPNFACCWQCETAFEEDFDDVNGPPIPTKDGAHFIEDSPCQGLKF